MVHSSPLRKKHNGSGENLETINLNKSNVNVVRMFVSEKLLLETYFCYQHGRIQSESNSNESEVVSFEGEENNQIQMSEQITLQLNSLQL